MQLVRMHATGFWIGFAFGTLGLVLLALLRLAFPLMEWITTPFFWPSHFFAELLTDGSASTFMVIVLYLLTGGFYGLCGSWIQSIKRRLRSRSSQQVIAPYLAGQE